MRLKKLFTGIIKKVSEVTNVANEGRSLFVSVKRPNGWQINPGGSIAINGVCSTVKNIRKSDFVVEYMPETIKKTTAGSFQQGTVVNLERSMSLGELLDGHIVQGHVDTRGKILGQKKSGQSVVMKIAVPKKFMPLIAEKGSVSIDGVSLTVVDTGNNWFSVSLVDYTLQNTNLGMIKTGTEVNIETDVLAKYVDKLLREKYGKRK